MNVLSLINHGNLVCFPMRMSIIERKREIIILLSNYISAYAYDTHLPWKRAWVCLNISAARTLSFPSLVYQIAFFYMDLLCQRRVIFYS